MWGLCVHQWAVGSTRSSLHNWIVVHCRFELAQSTSRALCARALSWAPNRQSRKWNTKLKEITPVSANGIDMVCARLIGTAVMNILIVPLRGSSSPSSILPQQSSVATFVVQGDPSDKEHCRLSTCDCSMLIDGGACKCATSSNGS